MCFFPLVIKHYDIFDIYNNVVKLKTILLMAAINERSLKWENIIMLIVWITAAICIVLPFALGTSPLDALLLNVPGDQGNWWHALIGFPFFLSLPMIWLRLRVLGSKPLP